MAALRGVSHRFVNLVSTPNSRVCPARLLFLRGLTNKLFVKGISFSTTEDTMAKAFSQFGNIEQAQIIRDKVNNRSKGYGYVTFAKEEDAQNALDNMNGKLLDGRVVFVDLARPSRYSRDSEPIARGPPKHKPEPDD